MNKAIKTILIISTAVFGVGFLLMPSTSAAVKDLVILFEQDPLFNQANFLPGESVSRWVKVTNNSTVTKRIATEAISVNDPDRLGDVLNLEIKEGGTTRYNDAFSKFFTGGDIYLSSLNGSGTQTQYDFIVTFYPGTQNPFQGKSLSFDILIGFQGEGGGLLPGAGGGVGGFLPAGLTIAEETVTITAVGETSVTITRSTSYPSTSQVIYAVAGESYTFDLTKPNYGYPHAAPVPEDPAKVTFHSVTLTGLTPGTTYYYRTVSHASFAISREYSFTTLGGEKAEEGMPSEGVPSGEETLPEEVVLAPTGEEIEKPSEEGEEGMAGPEGAGEAAVTGEGRALGEILATEGLLAAIGAMPFNLRVILIIAGLIIAGLLILWLIRKIRKRRIKS
jgi:hypothetical protein